MEPKTDVFWNVRTCGAKGDRKANDRQAIQRAIDACHDAGGGTVIVPSGDYLTGTLHLKSRTTLRLEAGATIWGSTDRNDYDVPHLIYARDASDVSIVGEGRIDGRGEAFWVRENDRWRPAEWRPGKLIHFEECKQVRMRDVTVTNAPAWTIHPFRCDGVVISGVTILNDLYGPNTDGIDPNGSKNVRISDCHIVAGDDCIVIKATEPYVCENITVTNCTLETTCAALKLGTESRAHIRHLTFSNCTIRNTRTAIAFYQKDGGTMEAVLFSNITIETAPSRRGGTEWPIFIDLERRGPESKIGAIRDVMLRDMVILTRGRCVMQGMRTQPIERLTLDNITIRIQGCEDLSRVPKPRGGRTQWTDPEGGLHAGYPAHLVFANVKGLKLKEVHVVPEISEGAEERSAIFCDHVEDLEIRAFRGRQLVASGQMPALHLKDCRNAQISGCRAEPKTGTFLKLEGDQTADVSLMDNHLTAAETAIDLGEGMAQKEIVHERNRMP